MGYFANGTEGADYMEEYCENCVHEKEYRECTVLFMHINCDYNDCGVESNPLHKLIPRDENGNNLQCTMFIPINNGSSNE